MDKLVKIFVSLLATAIALLPLWIWLLVRGMLNPEGFWQNLVLFGAGVWLLGGVQILLLIVLVWFLIAVVWSD